MKKLVSVVACLVMAVMLSSCVTIYKAAVDERNVRTIAVDSKIKATIVKRFINEKKVKTLAIAVSVYNGHVYLVGEYENMGQKNQAIKIANGVEKVKGVTSHFIKKDKNHPCTKKKNLSITVKIKTALANDTSIFTTNVDVKTMQCKVVLVGLLGSQAEISSSIKHAKGVDGVRGVKSYLKVYKK